MAIIALGKTDYIYAAGYILPDGRMIDFSEGSAQRTLDHKTWSASPRGLRSVSLPIFIAAADGDVALDLEDGLGDYNPSREYYETSKRAQSKVFAGSNPSKVLKFIRSFYA
jgi:hypothetical protein